MAYQPKSYRKFVATAATATLVATAVTPAFAAENLPFGDVNKNYAEAVGALYSKNIVKGVSKTEFGTYKPLKRGDAAVIIAKALELDTKNAPNAGFKDVNSNIKGAVNALVAKGIISGVSKDKFDPNSPLTRGQMAKILVNAYPTLKDEAKETPFKDLTADFKPYIEALYGAGITGGTSTTTYGTTQKITRGDFAKLLYKAMNYKKVDSIKAIDDITVDEGTKLEDVKLPEKVTVVYTDKSEKEASVKWDKSKVDTSKPGTYKVEGTVDGTNLTASVNVVVKAVAPKIESVSAVGAKKLEVKFNKAVDDSKAKFEVKKGTINVNVANVTFSEDKKSATVELNSKLTKGDYTVGVTGLTSDKLTGTVTAEDERVEKVEILSTSAPLFEADTDGKDDVQVGYKVLNQYGEDITKTTSITATSSTGTASASAGTATVIGNFKEGDKLTLTLVNAESAKSASAQLTVSAESRVAELNVDGLINADGKTLTESTDLSSDAFYLEVSAKDQYGNPVTSLSQLNSDVIINETNPNVVDVDSSFSEVTINGEKKIVLKLKNPAGASNAVAGDSIVTLISKYTGGNTQYKVSVAESTRSDVVNMSQPDLVVVGEDALVPVEVTDKSGNAIKDVKVLNDLTKGVKVTVGSTPVSNPFVLKDGNTFIKIPAAQLKTDGPLPVVAMTSTNKVSTLTLNVKKAAVPTVITGLKADWGTTFKTSEPKYVSVSDLVIEDQYGRVMKPADISAWLAGDPDRSILVEDDESADSAVSISNTANKISKDNSSVTITAGSTKGTEKVTFTLTGDDGNKIASSAKDVTLRVTDGNEYKSYVVDTIKPVYDEAGAGKTDSNDYDRVIKVYGVLNDGSKVLLTNGEDYTVTSSDDAINADVADGKIDAENLNLNYGTDKTEKTIPVTVTINATGEQFTQDVVFSKVAPKVTSVKVIDSDNVLDDALTDITATAGSDFNLASVATGKSDGYNIVVTDQYGVSKLAASGDDTTTNVTEVAGGVYFGDGTAVTPTLTITPVDGQITIKNNGTASAQVTGSSLNAQEKFNLTINYGGVKTTVQAKAVQAKAQ